MQVFHHLRLDQLPPKQCKSAYYCDVNVVVVLASCEYQVNRTQQAAETADNGLMFYCCSTKCMVLLFDYDELVGWLQCVDREMRNEWPQINGWNAWYIQVWCGNTYWCNAIC
jgi:hypothetical protein